MQLVRGMLRMPVASVSEEGMFEYVCVCCEEGAEQHPPLGGGARATGNHPTSRRAGAPEITQGSTKGATRQPSKAMRQRGAAVIAPLQRSEIEVEETTIQGEINQWLEERLNQDLARSTEAQYGRYWQRWCWWRSRRQQSKYLEGETPSQRRQDEEELLQFLGYHGWLGASPNVLRMSLYAIQKHHKRAGAGDPLAGKQRVWILVEAMQRKAEPPVRKHGVTPGMLLWLAEHCSLASRVCTSRTFDGVILLASCCFGFFFLARSNEFLPSQVVSSRALRGMDIAFKDEAGRTCEGLRAVRLDVQFSSSKTDQEGFGTCRSHYAISDAALQNICPVKIFARLQMMAPQRFGHGAESHLGLFRWSTGDAVTRTEVQNALRRSAVAQGLPAERFATHSLRIGGASALFHSSGNLELVRRFGRWSSATYHRYLWGSAEETKGVAESMARSHASLHIT
eukprot:3277787-Amphidinium_carterae.2